MLKKILVAAILLFGLSHYAQDVVGPANPSLAEKTAMEELNHYLPLVVKGKLKVAGRNVDEIYVGNTEEATKAGIDPKSMKADSWRLVSVGHKIMIAGGGHTGTLYGVYAFLENQLGIHWWTPDEEYLPEKREYDLPELDIGWTPQLIGRDLYRMHTFIQDDGGRFITRNRMNRSGDAAILNRYGGTSLNFGSPYHTHTFHLYFRDGYLKSNPEFFALHDGERRAGILGQLCLTNPHMKRELIRKMKNFIVADEQEARKSQKPAPKVYDLTANDVNFSCQCQACTAINQAEKSEMGTLLYFVNDVAREIKKFRSDILISTSAYGNTLKPPLKVRPESNVIIRLCITTNYLGLPLSALENHQFVESLTQWHKMAPELYVWIYAITYGGRGFPFASELTMGQDVRLLAGQGVKYLFWEHEDPDLGDMYALKVWLECKLSENPYADDRQLINTFMNLYYGTAGKYIGEYRQLIHDSRLKMRNVLPIMGRLHDFAHMTFPVVVKSHELFDRAEAMVSGDPILLQRVREARMGLDRYSVLAVQKLAKEFLQSGGSLDAFPIDAKVIIPRISLTYRKILQRLRSNCRKSLADKMKKELDTAALIPLISKLPQRFIGVPEGELYDFPAEKFSLQNKSLKIVKDPEAESGKAAVMPTSREKPEMPLLTGIYSYGGKADALYIKPEQIKQGGYHWYRLARAKKRASTTSYIYFLSTWELQVPMNEVKDREAEYDVWASIKFQGPLYPHGGNGPNGIWIERVILTKYIPFTLK